MLATQPAKGSSTPSRLRARSLARGIGRPSAVCDRPVRRVAARPRSSDVGLSRAAVVTVGKTTGSALAGCHDRTVALDAGVLVLAATPIGRVADASRRLAEELATADVVAAEDTRRLARLARDLGVQPCGRVVSYFDGNDERRTPELVAALGQGATVAVVTDGGMPSVSDPGYRLVRAALEAGIPGAR